MPHTAIASVHKPPELQEVAQGINEIVAPKARIPVVDDVVPVLAFTISADQLVRRVFWSFSSFTVTVVANFVFWLWPKVPENETRRYLHVWVDEPTVDPAVTLGVIYPNQGVIAEDVGGTISAGKAGGDILDLLSPGNLSTKTVYPGLPVDVFPLGRLSGRTLTALPEGRVLKILTVWERLAPPNIARAEDDPLVFSEA